MDLIAKRFEARYLEGEGKLQEALDLYHEILDHFAAEPPQDQLLPVFVQASGVTIKLGDEQGGIALLVSAAEQYAEAGLVRPVIELYQRLRRLDPDRRGLDLAFARRMVEHHHPRAARDFLADLAERNKKAKLFATLERMRSWPDEEVSRQLLGFLDKAQGMRVSSLHPAPPSEPAPAPPRSSEPAAAPRRRTGPRRPVVEERPAAPPRAPEEVPPAPRVTAPRRQVDGAIPEAAATSPSADPGSQPDPQEGAAAEAPVTARASDATRRSSGSRTPLPLIAPEEVVFVTPAEPEPGGPAQGPPPRESPSRPAPASVRGRGVVIAAAVIVVVGGAGALLLAGSGGDADHDEPVPPTAAQAVRTPPDAPMVPMPGEVPVADNSAVRPDTAAAQADSVGTAGAEPEEEATGIAGGLAVPATAGPPSSETRPATRATAAAPASTTPPTASPTTPPQATTPTLARQPPSASPPARTTTPAPAPRTSPPAGTPTAPAGTTAAAVPTKAPASPLGVDYAAVMVEGLPVVSVSAQGEEGARRVLVRQLLPSGDTLDLRASDLGPSTVGVGAGRILVTRHPSGGAMGTVRVGRHLVNARAPVEPEVLEPFLRKLIEVVPE